MGSSWLNGYRIGGGTEVKLSSSVVTVAIFVTGMPTQAF